MAQLDLARPRRTTVDDTRARPDGRRPDPWWRTDASYSLLVTVLAALVVALVAAMYLPV